MSIVTVDPIERFDNIAVSNEVIDGRALSIFASYTCPRCGERIRFTKQNLEERASRQTTNLRPSVAAAVDAWSREHGVDTLPYLDWLCPRCSLGARAYIEVWAGGKGDSGANIVALAEIE